MSASSARSTATLSATLALASLAACAPSPAPELDETATSIDEAAARFEEEVPGLPRLDRVEVFAQAEADGRLSSARKTKAVDARPVAAAGKTTATIIAGDGVETISEPAAEGDIVV